MQIHHVKDQQTAYAALQKTLIEQLKSGKRVLWLLSGGSNIAASVAILAQIPDNLTGKLTTTLIDERYGPAGHPDSNAQQLIDAGFDTEKAHFVPVLHSDLTMVATSEQFGEFLKQSFAANDCVIGQLGIGDDGHISGIKPRSPSIDAKGLVACYNWEDYRRITTSFEALRRLTMSYTFVWDENKLAMLKQLQNDEVPLTDQPAQILKTMPNAYVYTDQSI